MGRPPRLKVLYKTINPNFLRPEKDGELTVKVLKSEYRDGTLITTVEVVKKGR